jgi:peptidoglycan/LPS O-acetylase OafA/YrhL
MISKLQPIEYHPKFELLRGIAAIIVLIVHAIQLYWFRLIGSSNEIALISGLFGRHAVLLFFLLSGYLITLSILTNIIRNQRFD